MDAERDPWQEQDSAIELALRMVHHPALHSDLLCGNGALPVDVMRLIEMALDALHQEPDTRDEPQKAALFFVRHVLLSEQADHYRVLGLTPACSFEEIRRHYQLMVAIFHPDRIGWLSGEHDQLGARINQAYQVLRHAKRRASYDHELKQPKQFLLEDVSATQQVFWSVQGSAIDRDPSVKSSTGLSVFIHRRLPQIVLGTSVLLGLAFVLITYVNRPVPGTIGIARQGGAQGDDLASAVEQQRTPLSQELLTAAIKTENPPDVPEVFPAKTPALSRPAVSTPLSLTAERSAVTPPLVHTPTSSMPLLRPSSPDKVHMNQLTQREAEEALSRFIATYRSGQLNVFMSLFTTSARSNSGDLRSIRSEYDKLFSTTAEREFECSDVRWHFDGNRATANGKFTLLVHERTGLSSTRYTGSLRILFLETLAGEILIERLFHQVKSARTMTPSATAANHRSVQEKPENRTQDTREDGLTRQDAEKTVHRFVDAYQSGNLNDLLSLFVSHARSDSGGLGAIRSDYAALFRGTTTRMLQFSAMKWVIDGRKCVVRGRFVARVQKSTASAPETYSGSVQIGLVETADGEARIDELFNEIDQ